MAASVCAHLIGRGEPVDLVTEDGTALPGPPLDPLLDALAALRPSARADLTGPDLPTGRDVVAVLGARRRRAIGRTSWRATRRAATPCCSTPRRGTRRMGGPGSADPAASALRNAGLDRGRRRGGHDPRPGLGRAVSAVPWRAAAGAGLATLLASAPLGAIIQGYTWLGDVGAQRRCRGRARVGAAPAWPVGRRARPVRWPARPAHRPLHRHAGAGSHRIRPVRGAVRGGRHPDRRRHRPGTAHAGDPLPGHVRVRGGPGRGVRRRRARRSPGRGGGAAARGLRRARGARRLPAPLAGRSSSRRAGFGVLLVLRDGARSQRASGVALVAVAVLLALGVGAASTFVGTAGRFSGAGAGGGGAIGLSPFTTLRGQLTQERPAPPVRGARPPPTRLPARADLEQLRPRRRLADHPPRPRPAAARHARRRRRGRRADRDRRRPERRLQGLLAPALRPDRSPVIGPLRPLDLRRAQRHRLHRAAARRERLAADRRLLRAHGRPAAGRAGAAPTPWRPTSTPRASTAACSTSPRR